MNSELLDLPPPHDLASERGVIGSALIKPEVLVELGPMLKPDDFHDRRLGRVFRHITAIWDNGKGAVDATLLQSSMASNGGWTDEDAALIAEAAHDTLMQSIMRRSLGRSRNYAPSFMRRPACFRAHTTACRRLFCDNGSKE